MPIPNDYYSRLAQIESNNRAYVRATTSSASGLYQFIKSTWESLGGAWGNNPNLAFGGLRPSIEEQNQRITIFTNRNATALERAGIAINNATLYAAHFLGITGAKRILVANPSTPIEQVTSPAQRRANPSILRAGSTVGDFFSWLQTKTGAAVSFQNSGTGGAPNTASVNDRINSIVGGSIAPFNPLLGDIFSNFGTDITEGAGAVIDTVTGPFDWLKETFTIGNGVRLISIILGIALVIIAIIVLTNSSDSIKLETPALSGA